MRVGVYQSALAGLTASERLSRLEENINSIDLDLLVCPELFISGYNIPDELNELAEPIDGVSANRIIKIAKANRTAIVYGYPERDGDRLYNSALCISDQGAVIANHRKLLMPPGFESRYFYQGNKPTLFELGGMQCALLVCYDVEFPESVRAVAELGAQVIIVPTALAKNWGIVAEKLIPTRAFENGVWVIYANHAGVENQLQYYGGSCIAAPDGRDHARAESSEVLISATIDSKSVQAAQERLPYLRCINKLRNKIDHNRDDVCPNE